MDFAAEATLGVEPDTTFRVLRDQLHEIGASMPSICGVEELESRTVGTMVERVDRWHARVAPITVAGMTLSNAVWVVTSQWDAALRKATWRIAVESPREAAQCHGRIELFPAGDNTKVAVTGHVVAKPAAVGFRLGPLTAGVALLAERVLSRLIRHNLSVLMNALRNGEGHVYV